MARKEINCSDLIFLCLLAITFCIGITTFVKDETVHSETENRALNTFQHFTLSNFLSGTFQSNFELAISDQFWGSEDIRTGYTQAVRNLPTFLIEEKICNNRYMELKSDDRKRGTFNCEDYIMYMPEPLSEDKQAIVSENIKKYNRVNEITNTYYYFVDDPSSFDFSKDTKVNDYYTQLQNSLKNQKGLSRLNYDNYEEYKNYFYKNDHHWDFRGSYQGYLDITKMLGISNVAKPIETLTNHEAFFGSYSRATSNYDYPEEFTYYKFNIPKHTTFINGKEETYNHFYEYEAHDYEYKKTTNYYAYVYGDDFAEVIFDFKQPKKKNLLVISNSYSNAINELIAQHYNKTYVIDLRHYEETFGQCFSLSKYLSDKHIDETLILASPTFIWAEESNKGLES